MPEGMMDEEKESQKNDQDNESMDCQDLTNRNLLKPESVVDASSIHASIMNSPRMSVEANLKARKEFDELVWAKAIKGQKQGKPTNMKLYMAIVESIIRTRDSRWKAS